MLRQPVFASTDTAEIAASDRVLNAMTVDVEDYFQVSAFEGVAPRDRWGDYESRVCQNTDRLLSIFEERDIRATFFVLGWVAERFPGLVRRIYRQGHEIASHGYDHRLVYDMTPDQFRADLRRARLTLESITGQPVVGYRAPSYSITRRSMWALDVLIEEGYAYDASIYPIHHDRYGIPDMPRHFHTISRAGGTIWEVPGSTVRHLGFNLPMGGGGYFRLLPYSWTHRGIARLNQIERQPAVFYLHPWEIDAAQPRVKAPFLTRLRHYANLADTEPRLQQLVRDFRFGPISGILDHLWAVSAASSVSRLTLLPLDTSIRSGATP